MEVGADGKRGRILIGEAKRGKARLGEGSHMMWAKRLAEE